MSSAWCLRSDHFQEDFFFFFNSVVLIHSNLVLFLERKDFELIHVSCALTYCFTFSCLLTCECTPSHFATAASCFAFSFDLFHFITHPLATPVMDMAMVRTSDMSTGYSKEETLSRLECCRNLLSIKTRSRYCKGKETQVNSRCPALLLKGSMQFHGTYSYLRATDLTYYSRQHDVFYSGIK